MPAHDCVAGDGRSFWFVHPLARQHSRKIASFRDWLCAEVARDRDAAQGYIRRAVIVEP